MSAVSAIGSVCFNPSAATCLAELQRKQTLDIPEDLSFDFPFATQEQIDAIDWQSLYHHTERDEMALAILREGFISSNVNAYGPAFYVSKPCLQGFEYGRVCMHVAVEKPLLGEVVYGSKPYNDFYYQLKQKLSCHYSLKSDLALRVMLSRGIEYIIHPSSTSTFVAILNERRIRHLYHHTHADADQQQCA